jgi:hypothetical protein
MSQKNRDGEGVAAIVIGVAVAGTCWIIGFFLMSMMGVMFFPAGLVAGSLAAFIFYQSGGDAPWVYDELCMYLTMAAVISLTIFIGVSAPVTSPNSYCNSQYKTVDRYDGKYFNPLTGKISDDWDTDAVSMAIECIEDPLKYMRDNSESMHKNLFSLSWVVSIICFVAFIFRSNTLKKNSAPARNKKPKAKVKAKAKSKIKIPSKTWFDELEVDGVSLMNTDKSRIVLDIGETGFFDKFCNVVDIIEKDHLNNGDLNRWFIKMGELYLRDYKKLSVLVTPYQVTKLLKWSNEGAVLTYKKPTETLGKRKEEIQKLISEINFLGDVS